MKLVVVGGGIAGLAAAHRLVTLLPEANVVVVEREPSIGGKVVTEHTLDGFVIEGAADSFLSRKDRGVGLCEELGLGSELIGRRPENARSYVRRGLELHPLPGGADRDDPDKPRRTRRERAPVCRRYGAPRARGFHPASASGRRRVDRLVRIAPTRS